MISIQENQKACEMITLLIFLLKDSVSSNQNENTLLNETIILSQYVKLQNLRYNDKVHLQIQLPEKMAAILIPRFLIQPLVENVFLHAIPMADSPVDLTIRFKETLRDVWIEVCDTGIGFSTETFEHILKSPNSSAVSHIGLRNIQDRICTLYGTDYGLSLEKDSYFHTVIRISIPKHSGGEYSVPNFSS